MERYIIYIVRHFGFGDNVTEKTEVYAYTDTLAGIHYRMEEVLYRADDYYYVVDTLTGEVVVE